MRGALVRRGTAVACWCARPRRHEQSHVERERALLDGKRAQPTAQSTAVAALDEEGFVQRRAGREEQARKRESELVEQNVFPR